MMTMKRPGRCGCYPVAEYADRFADVGAGGDEQKEKGRLSAPWSGGEELLVKPAVAMLSQSHTDGTIGELDNRLASG